MIYGLYRLYQYDWYEWLYHCDGLYQKHIRFANIMNYDGSIQAPCRATLSTPPSILSIWAVSQQLVRKQTYEVFLPKDTTYDMIIMLLMVVWWWWWWRDGPIPMYSSAVPVLVSKKSNGFRRVCPQINSPYSSIFTIIWRYFDGKTM